MKKVPLLTFLTGKYPHISRDNLYAKVLCGEVNLDGETIRDPKFLVESDKNVELKEKKYVSRGGIKLEAALNNWNIQISGKVILDAGASTGGFSDCLLQFGAASIHAVDVGYNQIDYSLRYNSRIILHEKTNIMSLDILDPVPDGAVADLSFRSILGAASHILHLTREKWLIALIKPQFEISREDLPEFSGVVKDLSEIRIPLMRIIALLEDEKVYVNRVMPSPITGRKGNRELFFLLEDKQKTGKEIVVSELSASISSMSPSLL